MSYSAIYRDDVVVCRFLRDSRLEDSPVVKLRRELVDVENCDGDGGGGWEDVVAVNAAVRHLNHQLVARCRLAVQTAQ